MGSRPRRRARVETGSGPSRNASSTGSAAEVAAAEVAAAAGARRTIARLARTPAGGSTNR
ncbi:MAG: hypothetical protein DMF78_20620 [Acidobacteria bacterium]|nr:MAG: hypothetical protein DMF78_20620 [Acidobacteriota bacterium]